MMVMRIMTSRFPGCSEYHIFLKTEFDIVCAMFACLIILVWWSLLLLLHKNFKLSWVASVTDYPIYICCC